VVNVAAIKSREEMMKFIREGFKLYYHKIVKRWYLRRGQQRHIIARGGLGIYHPDEDRWEFIFLKWKDGSVKHAQFCDLKFLDKGSWIASLGTPQAIMVSKDLKSWHPLLTVDFDEGFNHNMLLSIGEGMIACSTGKLLLILKDEDIEDALTLKPVMVEYKAYRGKLVGYGFSVKHNILDKVRH
jgi:hypothetical protein